MDRPGNSELVGTKPIVQKLETPLGLTGSRGSGADVYVSFNLRDKEFNPATIEVQYGYDNNPEDGKINDDPTKGPVEYYPCTELSPGPGSISSGTDGIESARGRGADHVFIWRSAMDLPGQRFVTQDYDRTAQGRTKFGSDGQPEFVNLPGLRLRMRANDLNGDEKRWGEWTVISKAFDLNNNQQPSLTINAGVGMNGVTANAVGGVAATSGVTLNFNIIDPDSGGSAGVDQMAVFADYAVVPQGNTLSTQGEIDALVWFPATTRTGTADTGLTSSPSPGTPSTFVWDSVADVGTVNANYVLRITPYDSKGEVGATVMMPGAFALDNYTIFTDAATALSSPRVGHRITTLPDDTVLITGGRSTVAGASLNASALFYPGFGQTTLGAVAPTVDKGTGAVTMLNTPRSYHSQTRLGDDRVLVAGGFDASGNALSSMEIYDPTTGRWTTLAANMGVARGRHTAVLLSSGNVLFAGGLASDGSTTPLASAAIFNAGTETCAAVPGTLSEARHSVDGSLLPDGRVLIPGGKGSSNAPRSSVEIFTPTANGGLGGFSAGPAMSSARAEHSVSSATTGQVIVTGGVGLNTVSIFDPVANAWTNLGQTMSSVRAGHVGLLMGDGRILLAGGSDGGTTVSSATLFDPATQTFDPANDGMTTPRRDAESIMLNNGRALCVGGLDASGAPTAAVEIFTPDGGFNSAPMAQIETPTEPQSWAFGALLEYRLIDAELDPVRVIFQYSVGGGPWSSCTPKAVTIADDVNEGVVSLSTTATTSTLPIDPGLKNTSGDHLFIWDMTADIAQADYPAVRVRVIPYGADRGTMAVSNAFRVIRNSRVIPRFAPWVANASGTVTIDYHLQDPDPDLPNVNDARVEFEYGIDANGDKQILDPEVWVTCTGVASGDGLGAGYSLVTTTGYNATIGTDADGWHTFVWDSVQDLGSPLRNEVWDNVMFRITPYDFPNGDAAETKGRQEVLSSDRGFMLELDPNGLYLNQWSTQSASYSGSAIGNVKLDEMLTFSFNAPVDAATVGLDTIKVLDLSGRQILGTYEVDGGDASVVHFYPQVQELVNGAPKYTGTEAQTILTRGTSIRIEIPGYAKGTSAATATLLKRAGWLNSDPVVGIANLLSDDYSPAFTASSAAGAAAYYPNATAPTFVAVTPTGPGGNEYSSFTVEFSGNVSAESVSFDTFLIRVDVDGDGIIDATGDSIVPGSLTLVNTVGSGAKSVFTFTLKSGVTYPGSAKVLVGFNGISGGSGSAVVQAPVAFSTPASGGTTVTNFFDTFTSTTNRDAALTNALWNDSKFPGMVTGLRDGGSGADGDTTKIVLPTLTGGVRTFSAKAKWNFTNFVIPKGEIWRFTGGAANDTVEILSTGSIDIYGELDVSGGDGVGGLQDQTKTTSTAYPSNTSTRLGGAGIAGAGKGGDSKSLNTTTVARFDGEDGGVGKGATTSNNGKGGKAGTSYTIGHGAGGGAGHAQAGGNGGKYGTSSSSGAGGIGGSAYGTSDFSTGITAGSGGGGGGCANANNSSTYGGLNYIPGGGGGAGGGAVKFACNGAFKVHGSGVVNASGGDGGRGWYYAGPGGAGSGGSIWIISGGAVELNGILDVSAGRKGWFIYYSGSSATPYHDGGTGSAGRIRIEAPNLGSTTTRFMGAFAINSISSGSLNGGNGKTAFPGSSTATINVDSLPKVNGVMEFSTMTIPSGVTITLTGTSAARMRFTGNVSISGTLRADGGTGENGIYQYVSGSAYPTRKPGLAGPGGGDGGIPNGTNQTSPVSGGNGSGAGGGKGGKMSSGYKVVYSTWSYTYQYYAGGGGGGSNLVHRQGYDGYRCGWYAGYYGTGDGGVAGTGTTDLGAVTMANITGGSGGGAGSNSYYLYNTTWNYSYGYVYGAGSGGGAGAGIAIETLGNFSMGSNALISVKGGNGGFGYSTSETGGGGGGGSGGTVLVRADSMTLSTGATIDTSGGAGAKSWNYQNYYNLSNHGGDGGVGGARFEAVTLPSIFNEGNLLGYSSTTGSLTKAYYETGDTATTNWQTAPGLSPDFTAATVNQQGAMNVYLEGAMADPITGLRSTTYTIKPDLLTSSFNQVDGYKFWRLVFEMLPPTGALPEVYDVSITNETK